MMFKSYLRMFQCLCFVIITANAHNINTEPYTTNAPDTTTVISEDKEQATCPPYRFRCDNDECIQLNLKCDAQKDCSDGSDEKNCTLSSKTCGDEQFECRVDKLCIPQQWICDGDSDCPNGSDEINCTPKACGDRQFQCRVDKLCIPQQWMCDGESDCGDGSDEDPIECKKSN